MDFSLSIGLDKYINLETPTPFAENDAIGFNEIMKNIFSIQHSAGAVSLFVFGADGRHNPK